MWSREGGGMRFRVVAVPANFVPYDSFVVEDQDGRWYLFERGRLEVLAIDDAALVLTVFEPSLSLGWHSADELVHLLGKGSDSRRYRFSSPTRTRSAAPAAA